MVTYRAAKEVVEEEGFEDLLEETMDRVDEIEGTQYRCAMQYSPFLTDGLVFWSLGLHRQSELTVKEPFQINISGRSLWSWLWPGKPNTQTIEVEGLGASFVPAEKDNDKA